MIDSFVATDGLTFLPIGRLVEAVGQQVVEENAAHQRHLRQTRVWETFSCGKEAEKHFDRLTLVEDVPRILSFHVH